MTCTLGLLVLPLLLAGGLASCGDTSPSSELSSSSSSHDANKALEKLGKGSLDAAWTKAPFDKLGKDAIEDDDTGDETSAENDEEGDTFEDSADDWSSAEDNSSTATDSTATGTDTATDSTDTSTQDTDESFVCEPSGAGDDACGLADGVCEANPLAQEAGVACCDDADCSCDLVLATCMNPACQRDGFCDCACQGADDDCLAGECDEVEGKAEPAAPHATCPESQTPVEMFMSNDDSNSQASPALVRRVVNDGSIVSPEHVRIWEFLNYYALESSIAPAKGIGLSMQMRRTDVDTSEFTVLLSARSPEVNVEERPGLNLVFSLDTSGSMSGEPIDLLRATVRATASHLRAGDKVSFVNWSTTSNVILDGYEVAGPRDPKLMAAIDGLEAGGGTDLNGGLQAAYRLANDHFRADGINRVFLISDGGANAGVTEKKLIAAQADANDGDGIYLIGVGVGDGATYRDALMDTVTDAGRGAYLFIDSEDEAGKMFGDPRRFMSNLGVAARDVRVSLEMPWYFGIEEFHGEGISSNANEVDPQHLGPNDAMNFHQTISPCDGRTPEGGDTFTVRATYVDPITKERTTETLVRSVDDLIASADGLLHKSDVAVAYAKSFVAIYKVKLSGDAAGARELALAMAQWLDEAQMRLEDREVADMAAVMHRYVENL